MRTNWRLWLTSYLTVPFSSTRSSTWPTWPLETIGTKLTLTLPALNTLRKKPRTGCPWKGTDGPCGTVTPTQQRISQHRSCDDPRLYKSPPAPPVLCACESAEELEQRSGAHIKRCYVIEAFAAQRETVRAPLKASYGLERLRRPSDLHLLSSCNRSVGCCHQC